MTFETAIKQGYVSKTRKYLFPIINTYPQYFVRELSKLKIESVALIDPTISDEKKFYVICKNNPDYIKQYSKKVSTYRSIKMKKYVLSIEILDKWKDLVPLFLEGKYSKLYNFDLADIGIYPYLYNQAGLATGPNYIYHVLNKTGLGKKYFLNKLKNRNLVSNSFRLEDFEPDEYDLPPKEYDIILNNNNK